MAMLDDTERNFNKIGSELGNLESQVKQIGTSKDSAKLRKRISKGRIECGTILDKIEAALVAGTVDLSAKDRYQFEYTQYRKDLDELEKRIRQKENECAVPEESARAAAQQQSTFGNPSGFDASKLKQTVDLTHLNLEEQIQNEKYTEVRGIEGDLTELRDMHVEAKVLIDVQQDAVDTMGSNVKESVAKVEKGVEQVSDARRIQKGTRKKMCILAVIVLIIIIVLAVVLGVVLKKDKKEED